MDKGELHCLHTCAGKRTEADFSRAMLAVENAHPEWSWARIRQRAMVEMYFLPREGSLAVLPRSRQT